MALTGQEVAEKYARNMQNASQDIIKGVETTQKSQSKNAIAAKDKMTQNFNAAMAANKYEEGLTKSGDDKWRRNLINKGVPKIAIGIQTNMPEIVEAMTKVVAVGEEVKRMTSAMPKNSMADSLARVQRSMEIQKAAYGKTF
jgi:hypothetical protein